MFAFVVELALMISLFMMTLTTANEEQYLRNIIYIQ